MSDEPEVDQAGSAAAAAGVGSPVRRPSARTAGLLCLLGIVFGLISGFVTASVTPQASLFAYSFPYTPRAFLVAQSALIINHLLLIAGIFLFARSGIAGEGSMAARGFRIALGGMILLTVCEVAAMTLAGQPYPSFSTTLLDGFFLVATILIGGGLILVGTAAVRNRAGDLETT